MRKFDFAEGELYHVYNRGVDKRDVFHDRDDMDRFFQSMKEFNTPRPIGSIYEKTYASVSGLAQGKRHTKDRNSEKLVEFVAYCVNPNHFHFILEQVDERGIQKFMQKLGNGYTKYFNEKYRRSGSLFQGTYKAKFVDTDEYLLHLSAYVNLNDRVHKLPPPLRPGERQAGTAVRSRSSWNEYVYEGKAAGAFCKKEIVLDRFSSGKAYEAYALDALDVILSNREDVEDLEYEKPRKAEKST